MLKTFIAITTVVGALITAPNAIESQVGQGFTKPLVRTEFVSRKDAQDKPKAIDSQVGQGVTRPSDQTEFKSRKVEQDKPKAGRKGAGVPTGKPQTRKELELVPQTKDSSERPSRFLIEPKTNNDRGIELELTDEMEQNLEFFNDRRFKLSQPSNQ